MEKIGRHRTVLGLANSTQDGVASMNHRRTHLKDSTEVSSLRFSDPVWIRRINKHDKWHCFKVLTLVIQFTRGLESHGQSAG